MELSLFNKYKEIKVIPTGTLFDLPIIESLKKKRCAYCGNKLYLMRNRPMWYCKKKDCPCVAINKKGYVVKSEVINKFDCMVD